MHVRVVHRDQLKQIGGVGSRFAVWGGLLNLHKQVESL